MNRKIATTCIAILAFFMALLLTLYPIISNAYNERHLTKVHAQYQQIVQQLSNEEIPEARAAAVAYNAVLWESTQACGDYTADTVLSALDDYETLLNLTGNGTMGYIHIPKLNLSLPIYHGTEAETLERGVGHLVGSSLPVGGENTHTILTGHSGLASQKMFSDLDRLAVGDIFYLEVLDEVLAYEVEEINTVLPHDTTHLSLEAQQELCTLVTCTPFGVNTHRLLVQGHRVAYTPEEGTTSPRTFAETQESADSTWEEEYMEGIYYALGIVAIILIVIFLIWLFQRGAENNGT